MFCGLLWKSDQLAVKCWAIAFCGTAIAALAGSIYHSFANLLTPSIVTLCQLVTASGIGLASSMMLVGIVKSHLAPSIQPWCMGAVGLKLWLYFYVQSRHPNDFAYAVTDYLSAMAIIFILAAKDYCSQQTSSTVWITSGIVVSGLAAAVLGLKWSPVMAISPDALYHVVQMVALYLFFRGSSRLGDRPSI